MLGRYNLGVTGGACGLSVWVFCCSGCKGGGGGGRPGLLWRSGYGLFVFLDPIPVCFLRFRASICFWYVMKAGHLRYAAPCLPPTVGAHSFINVVFAGHMGVKHATVGAYCYSVRALVQCVPVGLAGIAP